MSEIKTAPGESHSMRADLGCEGGSGAASTVFTNVEPFERVKGLLSSRPLRRPNRTAPLDVLEDRMDLQAFLERRDEPGIPWEDVKRDLGL